MATVYMVTCMKTFDVTKKIRDYCQKKASMQFVMMRKLTLVSVTLVYGSYRKRNNKPIKTSENLESSVGHIFFKNLLKSNSLKVFFGRATLLETMLLVKLQNKSLSESKKLCSNTWLVLLRKVEVVHKNWLVICCLWIYTFWHVLHEPTVLLQIGYKLWT